MLQTKSFKFSDDAGINELLKEFRLAPGASIMVSNGELIVPYEDGQPMTQSQRNVHQMAQINEATDQQDTIRHSNAVVDSMIEDMLTKRSTAEADLAEAEAEVTIATNSAMKKKAQAGAAKLRALILELGNQVDENRKVLRSNNYEIQRLQLNIDLFRKAIV